MKQKKLTEIAPLTPTQTAELVRKDEQAFKDLVMKSMPSFIAKVENKEDMANSTFAAGQEMLLVLEDILIKYFKFKESDLKNLHDKMRDVLTGVKEFEIHGLSMLSPQDIATVTDLIDQKGIAGLMADISGVRLQKEKLGRAGLEYPTTLGATPFLKELAKRNKQK